MNYYLAVASEVENLESFPCCMLSEVGILLQVKSTESTDDLSMKNYGLFDSDVGGAQDIKNEINCFE